MSSERWYLMNPGQCCDGSCIIDEDGLGLHSVDDAGSYQTLREFVDRIDADPRQLRADLDRARSQLAAVGLCWGCAPPSRETIGMVCPVCGTDYGAGDR